VHYPVVYSPTRQCTLKSASVASSYIFLAASSSSLPPYLTAVPITKRRRSGATALHRNHATHNQNEGLKNRVHSFLICATIPNTQLAADDNNIKEGY